MKTTKKTAATKRLLALTDYFGKPISKTSKAYGYVLSVINDGVKVLHPNYTSGTGRYISIQEHAEATKDLLRKLGIEFEAGNDAPRGGKCGEFIKITTVIK